MLSCFCSISLFGPHSSIPQFCYLVGARASAARKKSKCNTNIIRSAMEEMKPNIVIYFNFPPTRVSFYPLMHPWAVTHSQLTHTRTFYVQKKYVYSIHSVAKSVVYVTSDDAQINSHKQTKQTNMHCWKVARAQAMWRETSMHLVEATTTEYHWQSNSFISACFIFIPPYATSIAFIVCLRLRNILQLRKK